MNSASFPIPSIYMVSDDNLPFVPIIVSLSLSLFPCRICQTWRSTPTFSSSSLLLIDRDGCHVIHLRRGYSNLSYFLTAHIFFNFSYLWYTIDYDSVIYVKVPSIVVLWFLSNRFSTFFLYTSMLNFEHIMWNLSIGLGVMVLTI